MLDESVFLPHLNKGFNVTAKGAEGVQELQLVEVKSLTNRPQGENSDQPPAVRPPFSLLFSGDSQIPLGQGLHSFSRNGFSNTVIFITPVAQEGARILYEAIFS